MRVAQLCFLLALWAGCSKCAFDVDVELRVHLPEGGLLPHKPTVLDSDAGLHDAGTDVGVPGRDAK